MKTNLIGIALISILASTIRSCEASIFKFWNKDIYEKEFSAAYPSLRKRNINSNNFYPSISTASSHDKILVSENDLKKEKNDEETNYEDQNETETSISTTKTAKPKNLLHFIGQIILSNLINVLLIGQESSFGSTSSSYYTPPTPYYYSPGVIPLLFRLLVISWITSFFNTPSTKPFVPSPEQHYTFERINLRYQRDNLALSRILDQKPPKIKPDKQNLVLLLDLDTNANPTILAELSDMITFILQLFKPPKEIIIKLSSSGGAVQEYAHASEQLKRLISHNHTITICIDEIAASGGYMMASHATKIIASPFALVGSIGVRGQILNFNSILEQAGIKVLETKSGAEKAPISPLGNVTTENFQIWQDNVKLVHEEFLNYVKQGRNLTTTRFIQEGNVFMALKAKELRLVDEIQTSDEYIWNKSQQENALILKLIKCDLSSQRFLGGNGSRGWLSLLPKKNGFMMKLFDFKLLKLTFISKIIKCCLKL